MSFNVESGDANREVVDDLIADLDHVDVWDFPRSVMTIGPTCSKLRLRLAKAQILRVCSVALAVPTSS